MKKSVNQNQLLSGFAEGINKDLITQTKGAASNNCQSAKKYNNSRLRRNRKNLHLIRIYQKACG